MGKGAFLGEFELYVMLAIDQLGADAYGVTIRQQIEDRTGRDVAMGAVYATLSRLELKQLVSHRFSDPKPVQGGRARKCFVLTSSGRIALGQTTSMLSRMMNGWRPISG